jgi:hypothetical protein
MGSQVGGGHRRIVGLGRHRHAARQNGRIASPACNASSTTGAING